MTLLNLPQKPVRGIDFVPPCDPLARPQIVSASKDSIDLNEQTAYLEVKRFRRTARLLFGRLPLAADVPQRSEAICLGTRETGSSRLAGRAADSSRGSG